MTRPRRGSKIVALAILVAGCSGAEAPVEREKSPRPVTVLVLKSTNPQRSTQLTGSVASWKTEQIGFQVAGRVERVLEPGQEIEGRTFDENGEVIKQGQATVIAELEKDRYDLQLAVAQAQNETAIAKAQAKQSELENVVPQLIRVAQAAVTLAKEDFARIEILFNQKAASKAQLDQARAKFDTSQAEFEQAEANKKVIKAELDSFNAQAKEAAQNVKQAQKDLDDTRLISPFHGQIAEVHEIPGGYVQAGEPVVTVQMMDPIKVEVSVSAETDAKFNYNDMVRIYLPDSNKPVEAMVYEKATIADAATRTFSVTLLVRNDRIEVGLTKEDAGKDVARIRAVWRLFTKTTSRTPPFFVNTDSLYQDSDGFFVWKIVGHSQKDGNRLAGSAIQLKRVRVVPGENRIPFLQVAVMRELTDFGELDPDNDLVAGALFAPSGKELKKSEVVRLIHDGETVLYVRQRWRLRPGDIVRVDLEAGRLPTGFYVPADTILERSGKKYVFTVESSGDTTQARRIEVHVLESLETLRRIESAGDKPLSDGMKLVADGALFLTDGESISIVE